jgi:hypothetical protein
VAPAPGPAAELNPAQQRVVDELLALGGPRPSFAADLAVRLRDRLEQALEPLAERLGHNELWVSKSRLKNILTCEQHDQSEQDAGFEWSAPTATGTVVHKAIEVLVNLRPDSPPLDAVDGALRQLAKESRMADWLADQDDVDRAELRARAGAVLSAFGDCWPPLRNAWRPRPEARMTVALCDERILLSGTVDLALFKAQEAGAAGAVVIDFKTGNPYSRHLDDLRFYALVHTIRLGIPPFRLASYYVERADWHHEDVDEELLAVAAARAVDGATRLAQLHLQDREPTRTAGPQCSWCRLQDTCPDAAAAREGSA